MEIKDLFCAPLVKFAGNACLFSLVIADDTYIKVLTKTLSDQKAQHTQGNSICLINRGFVTILSSQS